MAVVTIDNQVIELTSETTITCVCTQLISKAFYEYIH